MFFLYRLIIVFALPFFLTRLAYKAYRNPLYRQRFAQRFGFYSRVKTAVPHGICIHAVSVGEVNAASGLIQALLHTYPNTPITVTCMTPTGAQRIQTLFGDKVQHVYLPYDFAFAMRRVLAHIKPSLLIIMETEIWPNLLHQCRKRRIPVLFANVRLSQGSYQGYRKVAAITRRLLPSVEKFMVQTADDAARLVDLGANADAVHVCGNVKFDYSACVDAIETGRYIRHAIGARPVWIAASTREGEEQHVLNAFKQIKKVVPELLLILVPRHPERRDNVLSLIQQADLQSLCYQDTKWLHELHAVPTATLDAQVDVLLVDAIGVLANFYAAADLAFVGGSLVDNGGQNMLEPCAYQLPVLFGPSVYNFTHITQLLLQAKAAIQVQDSHELAKQVMMLIESKHAAQDIANNAKAVIQQNQGALARHLDIISGVIAQKMHALPHDSIDNA